MTATIRPLTAEDRQSDELWPLLWDAAAVEADALPWVRNVELPTLETAGYFDPELRGFAAWSVGADAVTLRYIAVDPKHRGHGIGRRLIDAVRRSHSTLPVRTDADAEAIGFYADVGFAFESVAGAPHPRYACTAAPLGDAADLTLAAYRAGALRFIQTTPIGPYRSPLADDLLALVREGGSVLELGTGPGRDADALEAAGLVVDRTDAAGPFVTLQKAAGHAARMLDVRAADFGGPYDAVFANAVLPHVDRPELPRVLGTALRATVPGGVIAASFKEGDGEGWSTHKLDAPRHYVYWRAAPLAAAFTAAGWSDVRVRDITTPGAADRWLGVTARRPAARRAR
ncbi:GNAT family N-acetyltransferase [Microbacterium telephonicum]|uniref:Ribosomal protein S18 acetylase RimI-like enzyme n=1 Tax=Microbacterium telephonicum TaxID=1714841 RepID=A0A498CA91_9MICO|nr:GNAT family N-acetyltransferase [Microbacterium telephonicum]RLK52834.1 ribosomal protein S18 acetylase RimI-like enzyme [Microbacterium telephonicum]